MRKLTYCFQLILWNKFACWLWYLCWSSFDVGLQNASVFVVLYRTKNKRINKEFITNILETKLTLRISGYSYGHPFLSLDVGLQTTSVWAVLCRTNLRELMNSLCISITTNCIIFWYVQVYWCRLQRTSVLAVLQKTKWRKLINSMNVVEQIYMSAEASSLAAS